MTVTREELHKTIEYLPDERLREAFDFLSGILQQSQSSIPNDWEEISMDDN